LLSIPPRRRADVIGGIAGVLAIRSTSIQDLDLLWIVRSAQDGA
jgi:hypothetical protein